MTYQRFEELPVWQDAIRLAESAEGFLSDAGNRITRGKQDQLDRCSLSVSNNIAEGFERGSTAELLHFLYIARGSAGEVRSMMRFFARRPRLADFEGEMEDIAALAESCSRQLRAWADSLQNSEIKGQRHLNDRSRDQYQKSRTAEEKRREFETRQKETIDRLPDDHPLKNFPRRPKR